MTLAYAEVASALGDLVAEAGLQRGHVLVEMCKLQDVPDLVVRVVVEWILNKMFKFEQLATVAS